MSFDGIIFRELVPCVPWRHVTEVPSFWKEGCSPLAGTAGCGVRAQAQLQPLWLRPAAEQPQGWH